MLCRIPGFFCPFSRLAWTSVRVEPRKKRNGNLVRARDFYACCDAGVKTISVRGDRLKTRQSLRCGTRRRSHRSLSRPIAGAGSPCPCIIAQHTLCTGRPVAHRCMCASSLASRRPGTPSEMCAQRAACGEGMESELWRPFLAMLSQRTGMGAVHFGRYNSLSDRTQCRVMRETRRRSATPGWACPDSIIIQRRAEIPPTFPTSRECSLSAGVWGSSEEGLYCLEAAAAIIHFGSSAFSIAPSHRTLTTTTAQPDPTAIVLV